MDENRRYRREGREPSSETINMQMEGIKTEEIRELMEERGNEMGNLPGGHGKGRREV